MVSAGTKSLAVALPVVADAARANNSRDSSNVIVARNGVAFAVISVFFSVVSSKDHYDDVMWCDVKCEV